MRIMMSIERSCSGGKKFNRAAHVVTALAIAAIASGCSADISRFDYPTFNLTGDSPKSTASIQTPSEPVNRAPSYAGQGAAPSPRAHTTEAATPLRRHTAMAPSKPQGFRLRSAPCARMRIRAAMTSSLRPVRLRHISAQARASRCSKAILFMASLAATTCQLRS